MIARWSATLRWPSTTRRAIPAGRSAAAAARRSARPARTRARAGPKEGASGPAARRSRGPGRPGPAGRRGGSSCVHALPPRGRRASTCGAEVLAGRMREFTFGGGLQLVASICHPPPVALEHALLVSLAERPSSGLELARRFDKSIGLFWTPPTSRSTRCWPGWRPTAGSPSTVVAQAGRPDKKVYDVTAAGAEARALAGRAGPEEERRSELAVKMRGAAFGDRAAVLEVLRAAPRRPPGPPRALPPRGAGVRRPVRPHRSRAAPVPRAARRHRPGAVWVGWLDGLHQRPQQGPP